MNFMRKLFGTDGIRGKANSPPMTPELMLSLGKAIAEHFSNGSSPKIVIGKDTRVSGYMLETALTSGLVSRGATVLLVGPIPTPAISHLTRSFNADAGIMISASHNPAEDNGIKIFDSKGYKLADEEEQSIESIIFSKEMAEGMNGKKIGKAFRVDDARGRYVEYAKATIGDSSLEGIKVVVDCANGAAYKVCPDIFSELGAEVVAINNSPDGHNINRNCGALHIAGLSKKVVSEKADLGIALDGDADRLVVVDSNGKQVDGDCLVAALVMGMKEKGRLSKGAIVSTVMSNHSFEEHMAQNGIKVLRAKVGDRYVIEEMRKGGFNFGAEQSGHIIFGDHSTTGDGIISALQLMRLMKEKGKSVSKLCSVFKPYPQVLLNLEVREKRPLESLEKAQHAISAAEKSLKGKGRVLVRYSGTENIARVMVEGRNRRRVKTLAHKIARAVKSEAGS